MNVYNEESARKLFPIVPDAVTVNKGGSEPTGGMWTPWCDNQQTLEEGGYIRITLMKRKEADHVYQICQSGSNIYVITNMDYSKRVPVEGDYNCGGGEYKMTLTGSRVEDVKFNFEKW